MKTTLLLAIIVVALASVAATPPAATFEYATLRWDGDNTCVILPSGNIDFVGKQLKALKRPDKVDQRAFYMSITLNSLGGQGYDFCGMTGDGNTIVMKRSK